MNGARAPWVLVVRSEADRSWTANLLNIKFNGRARRQSPIQEPRAIQPDARAIGVE